MKIEVKTTDIFIYSFYMSSNENITIVKGKYEIFNISCLGFNSEKLLDDSALSE